MHKSILSILVLTSFAPCFASHEPIILHLRRSESQLRGMDERPPKTDFNYGDTSAQYFKLKKQLASQLGSIVTGTTTGFVCALLDELMPKILLFNWFLELDMRNNLIDNFSDQMQKYKISHNKIEMREYARIISWLTYVVAFLTLHD
jgi:hypothetical protein